MPPKFPDFLLTPFRFWRGRLAALIFLLGAALLHPLLENTSFAVLQNTQFDYMQRLFPRDRHEASSVVVAIDEKSLKALGQWPWPRQTIAKLLYKIGGAEPHAIGLDIIFPEVDRLGPKSLSKLYPNLDFSHLPDPDAQLAKALQDTPSVLGLAAARGGLAFFDSRLRVTPIRSYGGDVRNAANHFVGILHNLPILESSAHSQALLNAVADPAFLSQEQGVLRRIPLVADISGLPVASMAPEMLRIALGEPAIEAHMRNGRITRVSVGEYGLPTLDTGELFLRFGHFQADRYISAIDVLEDKVPAENFRQRFVFIGFTGVGLQDQVLTPLGEKVPGVEVHVQTMESLLDGLALTRPVWLRVLETLLFISTGLLLIFKMPSLLPTQVIKWGLLFLCMAFALNHAAFTLAWLLFDVTSFIVLLLPTFLILFGNILIETEYQHRLSEAALQTSRENAARVAGELSAAHRIQMGLLPDPGIRFANETRFQMAACLEPAREVGGDFFDCFMLDLNRLCFIIGDVSGKGLPASLFMAVSKSLASVMLRQHPDDLPKAISQLNVALSRNNQELLFVTAFVAILDIHNGTLCYICAGHDAPWWIRQDGTITRVPVKEIAGPPLCVCEGFPFQEGNIKLKAGDKLLLITDGVTEANNGQEWFGSKRLEEKARLFPPDKDVNALLEYLRLSVRGFEAGATPMDDLTLLAVQWHGDKPQKENPPPSL